MGKKNKAARRAARSKRDKVKVSDRIGPTPETLAKLKPWTMQTLLARGPEDGGIDSEQFEAGVAIVEAYRLITAMVGFKPVELGRIGVGNGQPGDRGERARRLYVAWGNELLQRHDVRPHYIVACIEDDRPLDTPGAVGLLRKALSLWSKAEADDRRERSAKRRELDISV